MPRRPSSAIVTSRFWPAWPRSASRSGRGGRTRPRWLRLLWAAHTRLPPREVAKAADMVERNDCTAGARLSGNPASFAPAGVERLGEDVVAGIEQQARVDALDP